MKFVNHPTVSLSLGLEPGTYSAILPASRVFSPELNSSSYCVLSLKWSLGLYGRGEVWEAFGRTLSPF